MKFHSTIVAILCAIYLSLVEARFFIESVGRLHRHPIKPQVDGVFLYKCSKTLTDDRTQECEETVLDIGVPNFAPASSPETIRHLTAVMGNNDIAVFWTLNEEAQGFDQRYFNIFISTLDNIVKIYFDQVHRTSKMIDRGRYPNYVASKWVQILNQEERWKQGVKDVQNAMRNTMNKLIDPCAIYAASSRSSQGAFLHSALANSYCSVYCKFLKAAFLAHNIVGECTTIKENQSSCNGSVCTCTGHGRRKDKSLPMHSCNNKLRLKVADQELNDIKKQSEEDRAAKAYRNVAPRRKRTRHGPTEYGQFSPGSSPLSDRNSPGRSSPGNPWGLD